MVDKVEANSNFSFASLRAPWNQNENIIWLASTLRILRNIEKFKFPQKLDTERKKHIMSLTLKAFLNTPELIKPVGLKGEEVTATQKEFLIEHFLLFEGFQEAHIGTGFGLDATGEVIALFNIKDHLQLRCTDCSGDLEKSWARLSQLEKGIEKQLNFAFSQKFGYLTSDPMRCGTGLIVSAYLHVPALIHTNGLLDCLEQEKGEGIVATGLQGNPDELIGDILMLRNIYTLGINEESIISAMRNAILHIVIAEKGARSKIKSEKKDGIRDLVSRSIGLLKYSYQIEATDALNAISLLKLGVELGWVKGIGVKETNSLLFDCRRQHLTYLLNETTPSEDIANKRAEYLRQAVAPIVLAF